MCNKSSMLMGITRFLVTAGAINWGLVGMGWLLGGADWNIVHLVFGAWIQGEAYFYLLVGLAGVHKIVLYSTCCKKCGCK